MAFNKHWSSLFRRPVDDSHQHPQQPQRQHSQLAPGVVDGSNTYTFLQTKLLASTQDLAKLISDTSNRFDRDHDGVNKLLEECREVIKAIAEKSVTRDSQHSDVSTAPLPVPVLRAVNGELISIRAIVGTVADLNLALMAKLTKLDATVDNLVVLANKLENRMETNERQVAVISHLTPQSLTEGEHLQDGRTDGECVPLPKG